MPCELSQAAYMKDVLQRLVHLWVDDGLVHIVDLRSNPFEDVCSLAPGDLMVLVPAKLSVSERRFAVKVVDEDGDDGAQDGRVRHGDGLQLVAPGAVIAPDFLLGDATFIFRECSYARVDQIIGWLAERG